MNPLNRIVDLAQQAYCALFSESDLCQAPTPALVPISFHPNVESMYRLDARQAQFREVIQMNPRQLNRTFEQLLTPLKLKELLREELLRAASTR